MINIVLTMSPIGAGTMGDASYIYICYTCCGIVCPAHLCAMMWSAVSRAVLCYALHSQRDPYKITFNAKWFGKVWQGKNRMAA